MAHGVRLVREDDDWYPREVWPRLEDRPDKGLRDVAEGSEVAEGAEGGFCAFLDFLHSELGDDFWCVSLDEQPSRRSGLAGWMPLRCATSQW